MLPGWYGRMGDELLHSAADDDVVLSSMRWVVVLRCFGLSAWHKWRTVVSTKKSKR